MAEDAWMEECIITISKIGDSKDYHFAALTETVDIDYGEKDTEGRALVNGGRVNTWSPEGDTTITFEAYPLQVGTISDAADNADGTGYYDMMHSEDTGNVVGAITNNRVLNDRNRDKYRVLIVWTDNSSITSAATVGSSGDSAMRLGFAGGHFTSVKPSFTDGVLKFTITYKCPAFDKSGDANLLHESSSGTGASDVLAAVANYTTSNKFG